MENLFEHVEFGLVVDQYDQNYCMDPIRISNTMTVKWHLKVKIRIRIEGLNAYRHCQMTTFSY